MTESLFLDGCSCSSYGHGLAMTRVNLRTCPVHGTKPLPPSERGGCPNCGGPLTVNNFAEGSVVQGRCGYSRAGHWGGGELQETPCQQPKRETHDA